MHDRPIKRRNVGEIHLRILLRTAGGRSCHSEGPTTVKARSWEEEIRNEVQGDKIGQQSDDNERSEQRVA